MRLLRIPVLVSLLVTLACQPAVAATAAVVDGDQLHVVAASGQSISSLLAEAGVRLSPADKVLLNGYPVALDGQLDSGSNTVQIRRAISLSLAGKSFQTTAATVGEALAEAGFTLHAADRIAPAAGAILAAATSISYTPARELLVEADGQERHVLSAAPTIGSALAQAGMPLLGLDFSQPAEDQPLPSDGRIRVVRVSEALVLSEKAIPFQTEVKDAPNVELGQEQILQPGVQGLSVSRIRIRYEDGKEVSRQTEAETVVRPPQNRISAQGSKLVVKTVTVDGRQIQYWLQLQMYATVYSPCNSGGSGCSTGTASGLRAGKGVVAVDPGLYAYLNGQRLYIPGYGSAVIGDVGGGYIVEQNTGVSRYRWIDLGYDDNNIGEMSGWITVYFLAPAPATIPDLLR